MWDPIVQSFSLSSVRGLWGQFDFHGFAGFMLVKKLQCLTCMIREWKKDSMDNVEGVRDRANLEIKQLDLWEEERVYP